MENGEHWQNGLGDENWQKLENFDGKWRKLATMVQVTKIGNNQKILTENGENWQQWSRWRKLEIFWTKQEEDFDFIGFRCGKKQNIVCHLANQQ